ncbi:MAG: DUF3426 domain-containing protein [Methylotenera sp.]|nr:DUF3426 domain-containing protein [Methylotenera sp.]MDO9234239.1 DUF3426 domain-containing protein [Methylotenera sp.]MDP2103272.1 DUF3426 domain-containing protein [Methylotenera sp.]MDP2282270.1 DUF3426 domain-containing protein [Methylotenera sp.]MDP2403160.1 DUF3426 domain-containing protein [Methylotenera sp.]
MRAITRCPACETQFFVTEAQLHKHGGKVRCGQCLHVFDAKTQLFEIDTPVAETTVAENPPIEIALEIEATTISAARSAPIENEPTPNIDGDSAQIITPENTALHHPASSQINQKTEEEWPAIDHAALDENALSNTNASNLSSLNQAPFNQIQAPFVEALELSASVEDVQAFAAEANNASDTTTMTSDDEGDLDDRAERAFDAEQIKNLNDITKLSIIADNRANYFDDLASKDKLTTKNINKKSRRWLWLMGAFILLICAVAQTIYFLRDNIATYYPNTKPILEKACQSLGCSVSLPKQIESIVIDDSDMQEDLNVEGVMHLSSRLINKADFNLAYPNLELTLTDSDDNPTLRRVFKPAEYLPANTDIASGLKAGETIKIKLAITTTGQTVAGYRIFVTY